MKYMLLIQQGDTPTPRSPEAWAQLSEAEQKAVYGAYMDINQTPGVTSGLELADPETATTVRVQDGETLTTDGPFVEMKEALGGWVGRARSGQKESRLGTSQSHPSPPELKSRPRETR